VLVIDDDPVLLRVLTASLTVRDFAVATAASGREALSLVANDEPDVVILDLGLPDLDGLEVCRHLRTRSRAPIIVLSADGAEGRKVRALDLGADDYMTKPFSMPELMARIRVALRHRRILDAVATDGELVVGSLQIDLAAHLAVVDGVPLDLAPKEYALLVLLARNAGKVLTHRTILDQIWDRSQALGTVRAHIGFLRRRLEVSPDAPQIITAPGVGYRLVESEPGRIRS
jgi:two-component system KDP operon response regulator KdpE